MNVTTENIKIPTSLFSMSPKINTRSSSIKNSDKFQRNLADLEILFGPPDCFIQNFAIWFKPTGYHSIELRNNSCIVRISLTENQQQIKKDKISWIEESYWFEDENKTLSIQTDYYHRAIILFEFILWLDDQPLDEQIKKYIKIKTAEQ